MADGPIVRVLSEAEALARHVLFVRDRDELDPRRLQQLEQSDHVWVLERRELENYLLDATAISQVLQEAFGERASFATPDRIEQLFQELADDLRTTVQIKMTAALVSPTRLLDRHTINEMVAQNADVSRVVEIVEDRIPVLEALEQNVRDAWTEVAAILASKWEAHKLEMAPGEEILDGIWKQAGGRFNKTRDADKIASAMASPPNEFSDIVKKLARDVSSGSGLATGAACR